MEQRVKDAKQNRRRVMKLTLKIIGYLIILVVAIAWNANIYEKLLYGTFLMVVTFLITL